MLAYRLAGCFVYHAWAKRRSEHVRLLRAVVAFDLIANFYIHTHERRIFFPQDQVCCITL